MLPFLLPWGRARPWIFAVWTSLQLGILTTQRYRVTNAYHLFASIDPLRDEVEIVGSDDARTWTPLPIAFKPGEPMAWLAPYHPRVAFQLWFYPLGGRGTPAGLRVAAPSYVARLVQRWCTDPDVLLPILTRPVIHGRMRLLEGAPCIFSCSSSSAAPP